MSVRSKPIEKIPEKILRLLGEPPVLRGESREEYHAILLGIGTAVGATDLVDWVSANDIAYHVWDHRRLRRLQTALMLNRQIEVIEELLSTTCDDDGPENLILLRLRRKERCPSLGNGSGICQDHR